MSQVASVLRVPAEVSQLAVVRAFIRDHAAGAGADEEAIDDLVTAVDESLTNIIVHGYRGRAGTVEVAIDADGSALVVQLRDDAPAFDPTAAPVPDMTLPLERRAPGGLGIHLTRELTDSVSYRRTANGNELTLSKHYSQERGGPTC